MDRAIATLPGAQHTVAYNGARVVMLGGGLCTVADTA